MKYIHNKVKMSTPLTQSLFNQKDSNVKIPRLDINLDSKD